MNAERESGMYTSEAYWREGLNQVHGWLMPGIVRPLTAVHEFQRGYGIGGSVLEIGVHHGKFFIPLALLTEGEEYAVGIDLFAEQWKNIDQSGAGDLERVRENVARHCGPEKKVTLLARDSLALNGADRVDLIHRFGRFRIVSVDGGHTAEHTVNDLLVAVDLLQGGGVVILDDYYNKSWPGVHEGVARFFLQYTPKIAIFAYTDNKLFLTDHTHHARYLALFHERFQSASSFRRVRMWGAEAVVFGA